MIPWHLNLYLGDCTLNGIESLLAHGNLALVTLFEMFVRTIKENRQHPKDFHQFSILNNTLQFISQSGSI